jgi:hypothetical protein
MRGRGSTACPGPAGTHSAKLHCKPPRCFLRVNRSLSSRLGPKSRAQSDANGTRMLTEPSSRCAPLSESRSLTGSLRLGREVAAIGLNKVQVLVLLMTMPWGVVQAALRLPWSELSAEWHTRGA